MKEEDDRYQDIKNAKGGHGNSAFSELQWAFIVGTCTIILLLLTFIAREK